MTMVGYVVFVQNDEILAILVEIVFFYNRVRTKLVETLEGNHSSGFLSNICWFWC